MSLLTKGWPKSKLARQEASLWASMIFQIKLTTIRQPIVQFGEKSIAILIDLIENGIDPPRHVIMDAELVIRDSCGAKNRSCTG